MNDDMINGGESVPSGAPPPSRPSSDTFTVGVISDTHGHLPDWVLPRFARCRLILHAGDVGSPGILSALNRVAPLVAVRGNMDRDGWAKSLPDFDMLDIGNKTLYITHDLGLMDLDPAAAGVQIVVYGHTHRPLVEKRGGILYINPGSAGWPRHGFNASVAVLRIAAGKADCTHYEA